MNAIFFVLAVFSMTLSGPARIAANPELRNPAAVMNHNVETDQNICLVYSNGEYDDVCPEPADGTSYDENGNEVDDEVEVLPLPGIPDNEISPIGPDEGAGQDGRQ